MEEEPIYIGPPLDRRDDRPEEDRRMIDANRGKEEEVDWDSYTTSKSFAQTNLNLAGIGTQISLLLAVFNTNHPLTGYQIGLIILISFSLTLQIIIFALVATLAAAKTNTVTKGGFSCSVVAINSSVTTLTGILLIIGLAISSISVYAQVGGTTSVGGTTVGNGTA